MLEALAREPGSRICVAYVYIRYSDRDQVTVRGILEVLVKQTYERNMDSRALIEAVYAQHVEEHTQPTEKELIDLLRELSERMSATFYVLDALDEAPTGVRLDIIKKLASLDVRLFITSRPLQALEAIFPDAHAFSIVAQDQDLDLHIAHKIDTSEALQDLLQECDPALKDEIVNTVKSKCGGMYVPIINHEIYSMCLTHRQVSACVSATGRPPTLLNSSSCDADPPCLSSEDRGRLSTDVDPDSEFRTPSCIPGADRFALGYQRQAVHGH